MAGNAALGRVLLAALGVLAYKNRDRLGELFRPKPADPSAPQQQGGSVFDQILSGGGLGELLDRFRNAGRSDQVDSWVGTGPNEPLEPSQVEAAIEPETLDALVRQTGMSRDEILRRLAVDLPQTVDEMSPDGRLPQEAQTGEPTLLDPVPPARETAGADRGAAGGAFGDRSSAEPGQAGSKTRST
jgi:uncharacterized protein YidB (DUF937 family)